MPHTKSHKRGANMKGYSIKELVPENLGEKIIKGRLLEGTFDNIGAGIQQDVDKWSDDDNLNIHEKRLKELLIGVGDTYSDMRTIDKEELKEAWKNPIDFKNQVGSFLGVRGLEAAAWLSDQTLGRFGRGVGQALRIDPRGREVLGVASQFYTPLGVKKLPGLTKGFLKTRMGQQMLNEAGFNLGMHYRSGKATVDSVKKVGKKVKQTLTEKFSKDPSKRVVNTKPIEKTIDDVVAKSPKDIRAIVKIAKQNHISLSKAEDWVNLSKRAIRPKQRLNPGTNEGNRLQVSPDPINKNNLTYASIDDIRNAELALIAKGVAAPTTEDLSNYLSEYKTDLTIQPKKEWYNKNFKKTTIHDLGLYSKKAKDFTDYNTFEDALNAAEVNLLATKLGTKKRWQGIDAKIGDEYVKFFGTKNEGIKVLPYNKWHQIKKNPFVVPKDVVNKLKSMEPRQIDLIDDKPPTIEKITKKGNIIDQPAQTKFNEGTVNQFVKYVNDEIAWQTEQQRIDEDFAKALYKDLGIRYRRGKTVFSRDKSHAVARSEGGPGYTFLEAWWSNQQRGAKEILKPEILAELGIPRTWEEYFYRWYQQQGLGEPVTDLGKLADISWDDYERAMNGVPVNQIKIDRRTINHLIQRQIKDNTTLNQPGNLGATIGEDFDILVKRTKGLNPDDELLGEINPKEFDLRWRANTYQTGLEAKGEFLKEKYEKKVYQKAYRQNVKEQKQAQKKASRETKQLEKKGQGKLFDFLNNLFPDD